METDRHPFPETRINYLQEELEAAHAELRLYQAKLAQLPEDLKLSQHNLAQWESSALNNAAEAEQLKAENSRLRACLEGFKLALDLVGRWPRTVEHVKKVLGEDYHCYENEPLTYKDENGVERVKSGAGKVIREYKNNNIDRFEGEGGKVMGRPYPPE